MDDLNNNQSENSIDEQNAETSDTKSLSNAPLVPIVETTYSNLKSPSPISSIPPELLATLARAEPSQLFEFIKDYNDGERKLREITISNQHALDLKQEEANHQASLQRKQLTQFLGTVFAALFGSVLLYAYFAGDKALPDSIIKLMTGALAGGGGVTLIQQNSKKDKN